LNESAYLSAGGEKNLGIIREEDGEEEKKTKAGKAMSSKKSPGQVRKEGEEAKKKEEA